MTIEKGEKASPVPLTARLTGLDWVALRAAIHDFGFANTSRFLTPEECAALSAF